MRWNSPRQEGSSWRIDQMYRVFSELDSALAAREGLEGVKIAVGESGDLHNGGRATANKLLWALGNYSFFIRQGYVRIACDGADDLGGLAVSAYMSPEGDRLVLVGVNSGFRDEDISLRLPPVVRRKVSAVKVFRTDSRTDLSIVGSSERVPSSITARQRSITTIVIDL